MNLLLLLDYDLPDDDPDSIKKLAHALTSTELPYDPETVHLAIRETRAEILALLEE